MTAPVGGIWTIGSGENVSTPHTSDAAGLTEAKLIGGGVIHINPGIATPLGIFGITQALVYIRDDGYFGISRFRILDGQDPSKALLLNVGNILSGVERVVVVGDWDGYLIVPPDEGVSGQFLKSLGVGVQPVWADPPNPVNALLDGANHSDTVAQAVLRGALIIGNSTPAWDRLTAGAASTLLRSDGLDPSWGTVDLLSAFHADTLADAVAAGDLIIGNATPKWARLAKGPDGQYLRLASGLPAWSDASGIRHDSLSHVVTFTVATCKLTNSSAVVTTSASGFSAAKAGDRIYFNADPIYHTTIIGAKILSVDSDTQVTLDRTFTGGTTGFDQTATVVPFDHNGHLILAGIGDPTDSHDGLQQIWGNLEWRSASTSPGGVSTGKFLVGSGSIPNQPNGFGITYDYASKTAYFDASQMTTGAKIFRFPQLTAGSNGATFAVCDLGTLVAVQNLNQSRLTLGSKIVMDGTAAYTVFQSAALVDRLGFDISAASALRVAKWPDVSPGGYVESDYLARVTGIDGTAIATTTLYTVPTGKSVIVTRVVVRCTAATTPAAGPTFGVGIAAGEDDIVASAAHAAFINTDTFVIVFPKDPAVVATAAQVIKLGIDTGSTNAAMTLAVDIQGYLV